MKRNPIRLIRRLTVTLALLLALLLPAAPAEAALMQAEDLFTDRDLEQSADLSNAVALEVSDGTDVTISEEGVYVLTGSAEGATVRVEAGSDDKVQLVLDGLTVTNEDAPCIFVAEAGKVFVTLSGENALTVSGTFADGADGVIYSRSDLVLNGTGTLAVRSTENGIVGKDDLKITGGTYAVTAASKAVEANDSIRIAGGTLTLTAGTDGLHAENSGDEALGWIYIGGGTITVDAGDDAIHAHSVVQIDGGTLQLQAAEGIEGTYIQINGGTIIIYATGDGINGAQKSDAYSATIEINGGEITVEVSAGDTDGIDCNGDIIVNGGTVSVTGSSSFDYDGTAEYNGGTIIVNGQQTDSIPNQMMGGPMQR